MKTTRDLVRAVASATGLPQAKVNRIVRATFAQMRSALASNGEVPLVGLGRFVVVQAGDRPGMDIATREPIRIPAKKRVRFRPARSLEAVARRAKVVEVDRATRRRMSRI